MQRVKSANGSRKGCQSAVKHCRCELYQRNSAEDFACRLTVSLVQMASMNPGPRLLLKQPACDERFLPDRAGGSALLGQKVSEDYGCVDVDHRSLRSPASSLRISLSGATGAGGDGTSPGGSAGGEIHPCLTASASFASAETRRLDALGGPNPAMTLVRSVIRTVSPDAASRTYSLRRRLRASIPIARTQ